MACGWCRLHGGWDLYHPRDPQGKWLIFPAVAGSCHLCPNLGFFVTFKQVTTLAVQSYHILMISDHNVQPWINKLLGCFIRGIPFKYQIMPIWGVPP